MIPLPHFSQHQGNAFVVLFAPVCLFGLIWVVLYGYTRGSDWDQLLHEQVERASLQFAVTSEYAFIFSDAAILSRLTQTVLANPEAGAVQVFDSRQRLLTELGHSRYSLATQDFPTEVMAFDVESTHVHIRPIFTETLELPALLGHQPIITTPKNQSQISGWIKIEANTAELSLQKLRLSAYLAMGYILFCIVYALACFYITRRLLSPYAKLSIALNSLAQEHFFEIESLSLPELFHTEQDNIQSVSQRLRDLREEMSQSVEQATEDMRRNMDSMEEKNAQLHIAHKEANESNRLKSQFLANISHEVRTPLNAILGYTQILLKDRLDNQQLLYVNTIEQSTHTLLAIIGDVLDFSKVEAGKLILEKSEFNIRDLLDDVFQILNANLLNTNKDIDLIPDVDDNVREWIIGDAIRIRQILMNLVGNAIKFTRSGFVRSKITLEQQTDDKIILQFQIIDSGIGIAVNQLDNLFKPFSQANASTTREFGGTGLGLVISRKIIEQMNGKIDVSSEIGVGSNFCFTLHVNPSKRQRLQRQPLHKSLLIFDPNTSLSAHIEDFLQDVNVELRYCHSLDAILHHVNTHQQQAPIDGVLVSAEQDIKHLKDIYELAFYLEKSFQIPCILMIQPPSTVAQLPELQSLITDVLLKPVSQRRLYQALAHLPSCRIHPTDTLEPMQPSIAGTKVLAVDDNPTNLKLLEHWLLSHGALLSLAYSGFQALEITSKETFDLILMDIQMPGMDGLEVTRQLRLRESYKNTPIIAVTAHALDSDKKLIFAAGMNDYLTKPIDENQLIQLIDLWCSGEASKTQQQSLTGIVDLPMALAKASNKVDIAKDIFTLLINSLEEDRSLIQYHLEKQEVDKLLHVVHRLHGATKYTGTPALTKHAGYTETHLKELGLEGAEEIVNDLLQAIDALLDVQSLVQWPAVPK